MAGVFHRRAPRRHAQLFTDQHTVVPPVCYLIVLAFAGVVTWADSFARFLGFRLGLALKKKEKKKSQQIFIIDWRWNYYVCTRMCRESGDDASQTRNMKGVHAVVAEQQQQQSLPAPPTCRFSLTLIELWLCWSLSSKARNRLFPAFQTLCVSSHVLFP